MSLNRGSTQNCAVLKQFNNSHFVVKYKSAESLRKLLGQWNPFVHYFNAYEWI